MPQCNSLVKFILMIIKLILKVAQYHRLEEEFISWGNRTGGSGKQKINSSLTFINYSGLNSIIYLST